MFIKLRLIALSRYTNSMNRKFLLAWASLLLIAFLGLGIWYFTHTDKSDTQNQQKNVSERQGDGSLSEQPKTFNKTKYSIDQPGSIWWIVNKNRPLPKGYVPPDLLVPVVKLRLAKEAEQMQFSGKAETALNEMFAAAQKDGVVLVFGSGYRSEALQKEFYDSYVAKDGKEAADKYSAIPGTSEHQTGLSFDATSVNEKCHLEICFAETPEGKWIKANSYKYGFIIRYPEGKESITTYQFEPWHLRYVGTELAAELQRTGQTMEEFFDLQ